MEFLEDGRAKMQNLKVLYEAGLLSEETYKSMVEELVQSVN